MTPADRPELIKGFEHLSASSRQRRFLAGIRRLGDRQLDWLLSVDGREHLALVAVELDDDGHERTGVGVAHSFRDPVARDLAEFAITVADEWQGLGIGTLLARALADEAVRTGIRRWKATMLADNQPVQHVLGHLGPVIERHVDHGVLDYVYALRPSGAPTWERAT